MPARVEAILGVEAGGRPWRKSRSDRPIGKAGRRWFESRRHGAGAFDRL